MKYIVSHNDQYNMPESPPAQKTLLSKDWGGGGQTRTLFFRPLARNSMLFYSSIGFIEILHPTS